MRLRPGLRVARRGPCEVQVGVDPRWAVRVRGLSGAQADRLLADGGRSLDGGLPPPVLDRLDQAGLLRGPARRTRRAVPALQPEVVAHGLVRADGDGHAVLHRRAGATVRVEGLDAVGVTVARVLAASGVGRLRVVDESAVRAEDVGAGLADVGTPRAAALTAALARWAPRVRVVGADASDPPDVAVTVARDAVDPAQVLALAAADVPHLPVAVREADALVGPFTGGAVGIGAACLRCLDLHRAAADPAWPAVLAQLVARRRPPVAGPTAVLACVVGGLVAAEVLAHLDGDRPRTVGGQYVVPVPDAVPRLDRWPVHPDCGCTGLG
ncbi:ThiF family adenylyltransferase [Cellulomonas triticagri]|uniref:ThiF family adenylyltransferase n=1 Tax=Cellulomonas triticagri TaxID=2483352 RepID=UPI0013154769|nr:ThiF family adenylyltransferase [Cellulomonas triticagri]